LVGVDQIETLGPLAERTEGYFQIPFDIVLARPRLCQAVRGQLPEGLVVVFVPRVAALGATIPHPNL
jgi:hypothetical protein